MFDNPKGYWIGLAIGTVIAIIVNMILVASFGTDFWRSVLVALVIIHVSTEIGGSSERRNS